MKLWKMICSSVLAIAYLPLAIAASMPSPAGYWSSYDEKDGVKRAVIQLTVSGDTLNGRLVKIFPKAGDSAICTDCPGAFKDKKIEGLDFVWGLKDKGHGEWADGSILDPKTGKIYKAKMTLKGNKLFVRGYIGVSLLGRTQTWVRE